LAARDELEHTRNQIAGFEAAITAARSIGPSEDTDPVIWQAYLDGMESMKNTLLADEARLSAFVKADTTEEARN
jgi:hypothetical protein